MRPAGGGERERVAGHPLARARSYILIWLLACVARVGAEPAKISGRAMGTDWTVTYVPAPSMPAAEEIARRVAARLEGLEQMFSTYRPNSEVSRLNAARTTEWIPVAREVAFVAAECRWLSELTGGAFDATVAPLVALWGFGPEGRVRSLPEETEIVGARMRVGWQRLEVRAEPPALRKRDARLAVDFSSLAKGFAADELSALLAALGMANHLVQVGGDVKSAGRGAADTAGWRVGIEEPREGAREIATVIALAKGNALSTSGDYRNAFVRDGRRYGHIIDPRTGRPAASALAAVSVVQASCARSSALATGLFVLGPEEGFRVATEQRIAALFFVRKGDAIVRRATMEWERLK